MQKKVVFLNNSITYFFLHRKKFIEYFTNNNFKIFLAFPKNEKHLMDSYISEHKDIAKNKNIFFFNLKRRSMNFISEIITLYDLFKMMHTYSPNVVYTTTAKLGLYVLIVNSFYKKKIIINFSGMGFLYVKKNFYVYLLRKIFEKLLKFLSNKNSILIFENIVDFEYFKKNNYLNHKNIYVIKGVGVNINKFQYIERKLKYPIEILKISRIERDKGVLEYLNIIKNFENSEKFNFTLVGSIVDRSDVKLLNLLEECKSYKNFKYHSWIKDVNQFYKNSHIAILLSYREGMSVFLMEAAATGLPIIASNIPSNSEIVNEDKNGYLLNNYSSENFLITIEKIISNPKIYYKMSQNSFHIIKDYFDERIILSKFNKILDNEKI